MGNTNSRMVTAVPPSGMASPGDRETLARIRSAKPASSSVETPAGRVGSSLGAYLACRIALSSAGSDAEKIREAKGTLDKALQGKRTRPVGYDVEILYREAKGAGAKTTDLAKDADFLALLGRVENAVGNLEGEGTASVRRELGVLHVEAKERNYKRASHAKYGLDAARLGLLGLVEDMETLHSRGADAKKVRDSLEIIYAEAEELGDGDAASIEKARTLLANIQAREIVGHIVAARYKDAFTKPDLLASALGEVSLLMERTDGHGLAARALEIIAGKSRDRCAKAAANAMYIRLADGSGDVMAIPNKVTEPARERLGELVAENSDTARGRLRFFVDGLSVSNGTGKWLKTIRRNGVLNLANAYKEMVVLDEARRMRPSPDADKDLELLRRALDLVIAEPPSAGKWLAAKLMRERLDKGGHDGTDSK